MQGSIANLINIIPLVVSVISLFFSIKAIRRGEPNLKIRLMNQNTDAFYGATKLSKEGALTNYVACVRFRISNKSLTPVTISEISLQKNNETFELANKTAEYWRHVVFYFESDDKEYNMNGTYIDYENNGVTVPLVLKAYEAKDITCIFMDFPKSITPIIRAKLIVDTAAGVQHKNIDLCLYDEEFTHHEWVGMEQYFNSL